MAEYNVKKMTFGSDTYNFVGSVTGVKVNGTTQSPSSGIIDIGNVVSSINGNSGSVTMPELPSVTSSDNDKIVRVVSGAWSKTEPYVVIPHGVMESTSTSTAYVATVPYITELKDGVCAYITNDIVTATSIFTLNVNNLGAKEVCWSDQATLRVSNTFKKNQTYLFIYNSSRLTNGSWDLYKGYDSDTDFRANDVMSTHQFSVMKNALASSNVLFSQQDGKLLAAHSSNTTAATKTLTTEAFDPYGPIYVYGYTISCSAGSSPVAGTLNIMTTSTTTGGFDLRYAFNISSLTSKKPVYVKCSPQSNGSVKLSGNDCIVQELPSSADGYVYIFLGYAISTTNIDFVPDHPVYEYKNGAIRKWTNADIPTKVSDLTNDSGFYVLPSGGIPAADIASGVIPDVSGKADKSATVSTVTYDTTNKKITKTINGTTTDVVSAATLKTDMSLGNVENKSSATIRGELTSSNVTTALGFTPYNSTNPNGYTSNTGTVTGVKVNGTTKSPTSGTVDIGSVVSSVNGNSGAVTVLELPSVTSSDNGKVLRVVSGAWAAVSLPSASGVSF